MSKFQKLIELQESVNRTESNLRLLTDAAQELAKIRRSGKSMSEFIIDMQYTKFGSASNQKSYVFDAVNKMTHDIFRLAEMRILADARSLRIEADAIRTLLDVSIIDADDEAGGEHAQ